MRSESARSQKETSSGRGIAKSFVSGLTVMMEYERLYYLMLRSIRPEPEAGFVAGTDPQDAARARPPQRSAAFLVPTSR